MATHSGELAEKVLTPPGKPETGVPGRIAEDASHLYQRGKERAKAMEGQFEDYVRQNPLKSVLIAVGIGAGVGTVLGVLLARR